MTFDIPIRLEASSSQSTNQLLSHLKEIRKINFTPKADTSLSFLPSQNLLLQLQSLSTILSSSSSHREAESLQDVYGLSILSPDFGGLGLAPSVNLSAEDEKSILFLVSAYLESLNSQDRAKSILSPLKERPEGRRGMTLSEKIFAAHDIVRRGQLKPGDMVRVDVDFIMASELSWQGMEREYDTLGKPGIFRNDRFWLAGDHVVDPRIKNNPKVKQMVAASERARDNFKMTEYQGMNYTIMHTEFFRERAQPGMLIIGSDSHTCSAGSLGCLSIGLGHSDVTMPLITGETWFKVPESVNIRLINAPPLGIGGKDTILYILKELKRNTVASDRVVEFTGPGLEHLSCDARFAIANMTTEFGGISGIFVPDQVTFDFVNSRKLSRHKKDATYFQPDEDAIYASTHIIDLSQVESFVALYPSPDNVVPVGHIEGKHLDGCFIGACTTAEEDLIIGAMVLEIAMNSGIVPIKEGKRRVVPGSRPILHRLKELGFVDVYQRAGFEVGVPGCSYCVGMGADQAGEGEVWMSSQNRNFENRMGKGSIGNLASAATVAASSLGMKVTDPKPFLDAIDQVRLGELLGRRSKDSPAKGPIYVEPSSHISDSNQSERLSQAANSRTTRDPTSFNEPSKPQVTPQDIRRGKIQVLGDFIDTDALAPAEALTSCRTPEEFGTFCLKHTHPNFRALAATGHTIVVAGTAFGCGSSRENAVSALQGCGIQCVIAKSFAFIFGRNAPNLGFLGIEIKDDGFYDAASRVAENGEMVIDVARGFVRLENEGVVLGEWRFEMSVMERELLAVGGLTSAFKRFGKGLFDVLCKQSPSKVVAQSDKSFGSTGHLQW